MPGEGVLFHVRGDSRLLSQLRTNITGRLPWAPAGTKMFSYENMAHFPAKLRKPGEETEFNRGDKIRNISLRKLLQKKKTM